MNGSAIGSKFKSTGLNGAIRKTGLHGLTNGGLNGFHHPSSNKKINEDLSPHTIGKSSNNGHQMDKVNGGVVSDNGYHTDKMNGSTNGNHTNKNGLSNGNHTDDMNGHENDDHHEDEYDEDDDELPDDFLDELNGLYCGGAPVEVKDETEQVLSWGSTQHKPAMTKQQESRERARKASRDLIREKNDTSGGGRRSLKREHVIIKWILKVTHKDKDSSIDFADWIKDGKVLTQVMTTLCFNSVENDLYASFGCSPEEKRIQSLITQVLDYGVDKKYIFSVEDVFLKKNTPKVIRCLEEVAKLARQETHIKYDTLLENKLYT